MLRLLLAAMMVLICAHASAAMDAARAGQVAKIDALILSKLKAAGQSPNAPLTDEQFVRRIYIDVAGRIPTAEELAGFLSDGSSNKRERLIDKLLLSDGYNSQMFNWTADMLRIKDEAGKGGRTFVYQEWLKDQIAADKPWSDTVQKMMTATGRIVDNGPTGYLLRDKGMPLDNLSNTMTVFLGANVACAQCHDHPRSGWTQRQFYEMAAFFGNAETYQFKAQKMMNRLIRTSSEFDEGDKRFLRMLLEQNALEVKEIPGRKLEFPEDYKYSDAKPGDAVQPKLIWWQRDDVNGAAYKVDLSKPEHWRESFAKWLTHPDNPRFAVAIANRLWKKAFGLAPCEPVTDLDDYDKSPHADLLNVLADEMRRVNFSLKEFQRTLYYTQAYQRLASATPDPDKGPYLFPGPVLRRMSAEQIWDSMQTLIAGEQVDHYRLRRADELRQYSIPEKEITLKVAEAAAKRLQAKGEKNLTVARNLEMDNGGSPVRVRNFVVARASELEQPSKESHLLRMFGQSDRNVADNSSLEGSIPQILYRMNGSVQELLGSPASLTYRTAAKLGSVDEQIDYLYRSILSRRPTAEQAAALRAAFKKGLSLSEAAWVLFNTSEFIFVQ
ncbi:MAG TPA: DUF1549 domain-containing protein [Planctomycetota bacterium]|nr:DUF1549 domain-containing protein [Planctomycetota bacterium]